MANLGPKHSRALAPVAANAPTPSTAASANSQPSKLTGWRIPHEIRSKIAAMSPTLGSRTVAAMTGVSDRTVCAIWREFGVTVMPRGAVSAGARTSYSRAHHWPLRPRTRRNWAKRQPAAQT